MYLRQGHLGQQYELRAFSLELGGNFLQITYIGVGNLLSMGLAWVALGLYKRRPWQLQLCSANFLAIGVTFLLIVYYVQQFPALPSPEGRYDMGAWTIVAAMAFNLLARYFIRKDERLVKAADKLR